MAIPKDHNSRQLQSIVDSTLPLLPNTSAGATQPAQAVMNPDGTFIGSGGGGSTTANQGTPNTIANAWPVKITDGTNTASVTAASALKVDGSAVTQPISAASLPLPTGASTSANQTTGNTTLSTIAANQTNGTQHTIVDSGSVSVSNFPATTTVVQPSGANLHVDVDNFPATQPVSGTVTVTQATGTNLHTVVDSGSITANAGTNLNTSALALESGGHLASIDSKFNTLGQKTMANSAPVVIASDQSAIPISGSITATNASIGLTGATAPTSATEVGGVFNTVLPTLSNGQLGATQLDSNSRLLIGSIAGALPAGTNVIGHVIADSGSTTAVTGNVTVIQPTGTNLHAVLDSGSTTTVTQATGTNLHTVLDSGTLTSITNPVTVAQATAANLNATVVQSSGTNLHVNVDNFPATQPVSGTVTANAGTGTFQENMAQISGTAASVNNGTVDNGTLRVTIASNSTGTVAATQSGTWNVNNVSGTVSLPTNAAQETGGNLATVVSNTNRSTSVTSFQSSVTTSEAALATNTSKSVAIKAPKTNTDNVYVGTTGVLSSTGYLLEPGDAISMDITNSNLVHAVAASGTQTLTVLVNN